MELNKIKPSLSFIKKSYRPLLKKLVVDDEGLYCTDNETFVQFEDNFGLTLGMHDFDSAGLIESSPLDDSILIEKFSYMHDDCERVTVKLDDLFNCLKFSSDDETRLYLNSVAFDCSHMVGINGHIMRTFPTVSLNKSYLIPRTSLKVLEKLMKSFKLKGEVTFNFDDSFVIVHTLFFRFKARLIQREFPKWQSVIPKSFINEVTLNNIPDLTMVKPLLNKNKLTVIIESLENKIYLRIEGSDIKFLLGETTLNFRLGFNMKYIDICKNKQKSVVLKFNEALSACLLNDAIIMPIKL